MSNALDSEEFDRRDWLYILVAAVVCMLLKVAFATQRGFWLDELYTLHAAMLSLPEMWADRIKAGHSPLPFLYVQLFEQFLGSSERALKVSSAVAAAAAVVGSAGLLGALGLRRYVLPFLVIATVHPYWQHIGTELRYPMLVVAVAAFWSWAMTCWLRDGRPSAWVVTALLAALTLWLHGSAQFILASLIVYAILASRGGKQMALKVSPLIAGFLICLPFLMVLQRHSAYDKRSGLPALEKAIFNQNRTYFGDEELLTTLTQLHPSIFAVGITILFIVACVIAVPVARREFSRTANAFFLSVLVALPLSTMVYTLVGKNIQGTERYVAFSSIAIAIVFAIAWRESSRRGAGLRRGYRVGFTICTAVFFVVVSLNQGDWHRETIRWLATFRTVDEPIVTNGKSMNLFALNYYGDMKDGFINGVGSEEKDPALTEEMLRGGMDGASVVYLFLYRPAREVEPGPLMEKLKADGLIVEWRSWRVHGSLAVYAMARNEAGIEKLKAIPPLPLPTITHRGRGEG